MDNLKLKPTLQTKVKSQKGKKEKKNHPDNSLCSQTEKKETLKLQTKALYTTFLTETTNQNNFKKEQQKWRKVEKLTKEMFE